MKITFKSNLILLLPLLLQACTNALQVSGEFPRPLIQAAPYSAAVYFDDEFRNYAYTEKSRDRGKWIISTGNAQIKLFNAVLPQLFSGVTQIDTLPEPQHPASSDLVLHPKIIDFQYSIPRETRFKVFEVWLKYNIKAFDARGSLVADWILTGYGKTPSAFMQSDEKAMNAAAVVALRDLGANLSITTLRVPEIKSWIESRSNITARAQPAAGQADKAEAQP